MQENNGPLSTELLTRISVACPPEVVAMLQLMLEARMQWYDLIAVLIRFVPEITSLVKKDGDKVAINAQLRALELEMRRAMFNGVEGELD